MVGVPDEVRGEVVEAFVVLHARTGDDELATELQQLVRTRYVAHAYPRRVHLVDELPKTPSARCSVPGSAEACRAHHAAGGTTQHTLMGSRASSVGGAPASTRPGA